jgi:hypothetical protein
VDRLDDRTSTFQLLKHGPAELEGHLDGMATAIWRTLYDLGT